MNLVEFLRSVPEFRSLPYDELLHLDKSMVVGDFSDGHEFIHEGAKASDIYLVLAGQVSVSHRKFSTGEAIEIKRLNPGEFFGLIALIDHGRRAASCTAFGPVRVASLPYTAFSLLYNSNSRLSHAFLKTAAGQLGRDFRKLTALLRQAMFADGKVAADQAARELIAAYHGPERRRGERRGRTGIERRTGQRRQ